MTHLPLAEVATGCIQNLLTPTSIAIKLNSPQRDLRQIFIPIVPQNTSVVQMVFYPQDSREGENIL